MAVSSVFSYKSSNNTGKFRLFLSENAVDGGAAAAHGGVDRALVVEGLLDAGQIRMQGKYSGLEVVEDPTFPFFDREGVEEVAPAAALGIGGEVGVGFGGGAVDAGGNDLDAVFLPELCDGG